MTKTFDQVLEVGYYSTGAMNLTNMDTHVKLMNEVKPMNMVSGAHSGSMDTEVTTDAHPGVLSAPLNLTPTP